MYKNESLPAHVSRLYQDGEVSLKEMLIIIETSFKKQYYPHDDHNKDVYQQNFHFCSKANQGPTYSKYK